MGGAAFIHALLLFFIPYLALPLDRKDPHGLWTCGNASFAIVVCMCTCASLCSRDIGRHSRHSATWCPSCFSSESRSGTTTTTGPTATSARRLHTSSPSHPRRDRRLARL